MFILCKCCSHFFWYCFITFTMFCAPVFCLIHWFFSLCSFVIPSKCLKNFICAASERCSFLFFSTQASLLNFNAALAVILWIYFLLCISTLVHENRFLLRNLFSILPTSYVYKVIRQICIEEVQIWFNFPCICVQKWFWKTDNTNTYNDELFP